MRVIIKSISEEFDDLQKRMVTYSRKTFGAGKWSYEYDKPGEKKNIHEFHRITTMDEPGLIRRAGKITHPDKMKDFYSMAKQAGKASLAEHIKKEGVSRLGMSESSFA